MMLFESYQEVVQSAGIMPNKADVTSSNPGPLPPLCGHVQKKKVMACAHAPLIIIYINLEPYLLLKYNFH